MSPEGCTLDMQMRSSTIDVYADDKRLEPLCHATDDEKEKSSTDGWRVVRGNSRATSMCYTLTDGRIGTDTRLTTCHSDLPRWLSRRDFAPPSRHSKERLLIMSIKNGSLLENRFFIIG